MGLLFMKLAGLKSISEKYSESRGKCGEAIFVEPEDERTTEEAMEKIVVGLDLLYGIVLVSINISPILTAVGILSEISISDQGVS